MVKLLLQILMANNWRLPTEIKSQRGKRHIIVGGSRWRLAGQLADGRQAFRCAEPADNCNARIHTTAGGDVITDLTTIHHVGHDQPRPGVLLDCKRRENIKVGEFSNFFRGGG